MSVWVTKPIAEIAEKIAMGPFGSNIKVSTFVDQGVPIISGRHLHGTRLDESSGFNFITAEHAEKLKNSNVFPGDIVFTHAGTIGQVSLIPETVSFRRYVISQRQFYLRVDRKQADPAFVSRWFHAPVGRHRLMMHASQVGVPSISRPASNLKEIQIDLPPLEEQQAISETLDIIDDKIELNRRMSATLEEMARALYRSWFVDFDPVKAKAEGLAPAFMDETTAALFPDRFDDDGLPEGWEMRRLGDLLTLNYGKALRKDLRQPGQYPVYGSGGSDSFHVEALVSYPTIIVGRKGTVGSIYWSPRGCWPIDTTYYVSGSYPMVYALHTLRELPLSEMNTDAAVPGLNRENAYRLEIPFPGEALVLVFSEKADAIQEKIDMIDQEISTLGTLRDTLLPKMMSGELRVGEARERIEEVA